MVFLITRPRYDLGTNYLFFWTESIVSHGIKKGHKVLNLSGNKAKRKNFLSYVTAKDPEFIFFNGHGSATEITGQDGEVLVNVGDNKLIFKGRIIYARCCEAAARLGKESVKKGVSAFIGYKKKYLLGYSESKITKPLKDEVAKLFIEPSNLIALSILKGNSADVAFEKSQRAMSRNISFMLSTRATFEQRAAVPYLYANKRNQVLLKP